MSEDLIALDGGPVEGREPINELVPAELTNGRQLQILVRMKGSRPDKPHDNWYVIQIVHQTHRGMDFARKERGSKYVLGSGNDGDSFVHYSKDRVRVRMQSGTDADASTPRIWTSFNKNVHFNVWNAFGKLDNIPMIIDEREYLAIREAVEAYNQVHQTKNKMRPSNILPERIE